MRGNFALILIFRLRNYTLKKPNNLNIKNLFENKNLLQLILFDVFYFY